MSQVIKQSGRQEVMSLTLDIRGQAAAAASPLPGVTLVPADSGVAVSCIDMPVGAVIVGGQIITDTAFNAGATDTLSLGDASSATRYLSASSIHATGKADLVVTGLEMGATTNTLKITWTGGTPASLTTGAARLIISYVVKGRSSCTIG